MQLRSDALGALAVRGVEVPGYDRGALAARIVHVGVGGFHRAHLAVYCDDLAEQGGDWGICGIGLLETDRAMADVLARQDHLYSLTTRHHDTDHTRIIGSIVDYVFAADDPTPAVERIARSTTAIVSLTVTEAGYTDTPRNHRTFDVIAAGLARRRREGLGPITIMSCDNMVGNGEVTRRCVLDAARRLDPAVADWIATTCAFPNSMVDRITPATTDADRSALVDRFDLMDLWPVTSEPFRQWVIEDRFAAGRPDIEAVDAIVTDDVHRWELYKLRLLNAAHTVMAHLAALAGIVHVDEAVADPDFHRFLRGFLLEESAPTLEPIPGHPPARYVEDVLDRFANTGIRDQIARIGTDSTAKFKVFVLPILVDQLDRNGPIDHVAHALAAWARYLATVPVHQQAPDPLADTARALAHVALGQPTAFLDERLGFPRHTVQNPRFIAAFSGALRSIGEHGPIGAIRRVTSRPVRDADT